MHCAWKQFIWLFIITLANVDRFTKFFYYPILKNFDHKYHKNSPPHLSYVYTLPCETWKLQLLPISMAHCIWNLNIHLARYETTLIAHSWIIWLSNLENRRRSVMPESWSSGWLTYNIISSRQSVLAMIACLSVCMCVCVCVCVSHACIVSRRLNVGSRKQHYVIAQGL